MKSNIEMSSLLHFNKIKGTDTSSLLPLANVNLTNLKKNRVIDGVDFVRVFCAIGIVVFHFFCNSSLYHTWLTHSANVDHGSLIVYIFFIVSGLCIYKSNSNLNIASFYIKRWKSIFPSFYIAYFIFFLIRGVFSHDFNPENAPSISFILTILGLDGYFSYLVPTFYVLGEWFLGAIIILYVLYPLVLFLFKNNFVLLTIILFISSIFVEELSLFTVIPIRNIICCLTGFVLGMLLCKYEQIMNSYFAIGFSLILFAYLLLTNVISFIPSIVVVFLLSACSFLILRWLGCNKYLRKLSVGGGKIFVRDFFSTACNN